MIPVKCPACSNVWVYCGKNPEKIVCGVCNTSISGERGKVCRLTVDQYMDLKGEQILKRAQEEISLLVAEGELLKEEGCL
jgi:hypothetical protein